MLHDPVSAARAQTNASRDAQRSVDLFVGREVRSAAVADATRSADLGRSTGWRSPVQAGHITPPRVPHHRGLSDLTPYRGTVRPPTVMRLVLSCRAELVIVESGERASWHRLGGSRRGPGMERRRLGEIAFVSSREPNRFRERCTRGYGCALSAADQAARSLLPKDQADTESSGP